MSCLKKVENFLRHCGWFQRENGSTIGFYWLNWVQTSRHQEIVWGAEVSMGIILSEQSQGWSVGSENGTVGEEFGSLLLGLDLYMIKGV